MKKALILILVLFIAGCGGQTVDKEDQNQKDVVTKDTEEPTSQTDGTEIEENENDNEIEEEPEEKEPDVTYTVDHGNWTLKTDAEKEQKVVLLTIDDAPDEHALEMAQKLKNLNAPAIFFVNGHFMDTEEEKEVVRKIYDLGFEIGNHTMTHANLSKLSEEKQRDEIVTLSEEIKAVIGKAPEFFRAPFGVNTEFSKKLMEEQGMLFMNWTYGYDWEKDYQTSESIADIMVNTPLLTEGAILLMHDRDWTNEALIDIVKGLQNKGYQFVDPEQILR